MQKRDSNGRFVAASPEAAAARAAQRIRMGEASKMSSGPLAAMKRLTRNVLGRLGKTTYGGERDLYGVLGYPVELDFNDYLTKYDRQDIAGIIVDAYPNETWRRRPQILENQTEAQRTPGPQMELTEFERAWAELSEKHNVFSTLEELDRVSGIGQYAVMIIGVKGQSNLEVDVRVRRTDLLYLSVYHEGFAEVNKVISDPANPRFGLPELYRINLSRDNQLMTSRGSQLVHHGHVLHVAADTIGDKIYGLPRLKRVWNRLEDLEKTVGGGAEMFWKAAYGGLHADARDDFNLDDEDAEKVADELDEFQHGLRRFVRTRGIDLNTIDTKAPDPEPQFDTVIALISGASKIPRRVLIGSEEGEDASEGDDHRWKERILERQVNFAEPAVLRPFVDRLIRLGVLPTPKKGYTVAWPDLFALNPSERAKVAKDTTQALRAYAPPGFADKVLSLKEFRQVVFDLPEVPEGGFADAPFDEFRKSLIAKNEKKNEDDPATKPPMRD